MRGTPFYFGQFTGGLNTRDSVYEVTPQQARDLSNVTGKVSGAVRKRDGRSLFASPPVELTSLFAADSIAPTVLLGQGGTHFYSITTGGVVTALTSAHAPSSAPWAMRQGPVVAAQGPVYLMNGTDTPQQWGGGAGTSDWTAVSGTLPNGKYMVVNGNRFFVAGMAGYGGVADPGSTVVVSAIGDPTNWNTASGLASGAYVIQFDPDDGDVITGLGTIGPYVLVFKKRKCWVIYGLDTGANRRLSENVGCSSHRSIVETPGGTYWLATDQGVFHTDGKKLELVSDILRPTFDGLSVSLRPNACGAYWRNHYYLSVALNGSTNDTVLDYDVSLGSWWKHSFGVDQFAVWTPAGIPSLYGSTAGTAQVEQSFAPGLSADFGNAFEAYWTGAWQSPAYYRRRIFNTPDYRKRLRQVRADIYGHVALYIARDFTGSPTLVKDVNFLSSRLFGGSSQIFGDPMAVFGGGATVKNARFPTPAFVSRAYSLQWYSNHSDPWELENYVLLLDDRKD